MDGPCADSSSILVDLVSFVNLFTRLVLLFFYSLPFGKMFLQLCPVLTQFWAAVIAQPAVFDNDVAKQRDVIWWTCER